MNLLDCLTKDELTLFKIKEFKSNQVVFNDKDECTSLGIVLDGLLHITTYTENEKEEIITVLNTFDLFGQFLLFSPTPFYIGTIITKRNSKIALISKKDLLLLCQSNPKFLEQYLTLICTDSFNVKMQAKLLAHQNIEDRIMFYLKTHQNNNIVEIINVTWLANILSLPRPSVSRSLTSLQNKKLILKKGNTILLKKKL